MLTDFYNIWHVYRDNNRYKIYRYAHITYLMLLHYLGKHYLLVLSISGNVFSGSMRVAVRKTGLWCWDKDTYLKMDTYCRCWKWPLLTTTQAVKASFSSKTVIHPQLRWRASRKTDCKEMSYYWSQLPKTHWTIMSGAPCWESAINSSWSRRRLLLLSSHCLTSCCY